MIKSRNDFVLKKEYDVLVIGAGVSGISAAFSAKREGKTVCIIEKAVSIGGLATNGLVNWYEPLCDGSSKKIMSGLAEELLKLSIKDGISTLDPKWLNDGVSTKGRYSTFFSPTLFAVRLNELLASNNIDIRYDSLATYPILEGNKVTGIIVETVSGTELYEAKVVIDATGTAIIFDRAGAPCEKGQNYLGYLTYIADFNGDIKERIDLRKWVYSGSNMHGYGHPEGYDLLVGDTSDDVNLMITKGQLLLFDKIKQYDNAEIVNTPSIPQFRMIKHMVGEYELTDEDFNQRFDDSVGVVGNYLQKDDWLEIPYRSLYNKDFPNLLPAGRIISASGKAWDVTRVIPAAVLTGEVVGIVASMMIDNSISASEIDIEKLQEKLKDNGLILHYE